MKLTEISIEELKRAYLATLRTSGPEAPATLVLWRELDRRIRVQRGVARPRHESKGRPHVR